MKKTKVLSFIIPLLVVAIISVLGLFTEIMEAIDYKLYDALLNLKPMAKTSDNFLNVAVDDETLDILDMYPLQRSTLADGMMVLKELGADTILLDTQLVNPTPTGVNSEQLEKMPQLISQANDNTFSYASQLVGAYARGNLGTSGNVNEELNEYLDEMRWEYDDIFDNLLNETNKISLNFDDYISNSFKFMDNVYVTNDFEQGRVIEEEFINYLKENQSIKNLDLKYDYFLERGGYNPTIYPIMKVAKGSGFVETNIDSDGKTRKTDLIINMENKYYPLLAFDAYLDKVGNPEIEVQKSGLLLKGVKREGKDPYNLKIPLNSDGTMTINWAGKNFKETFNLMRFFTLYVHDKAIDDIYRRLNLIINYNQTNNLATAYRFKDIAKIYERAEEIKDSGDNSLIDEYRELRDEFIRQIGIAFNGEEDRPSIDKVYRAQAEEFMKSYTLSEEDTKTINDQIVFIENLFNEGRDGYKTITENREKLRETIKDSIVTFGYIATSTFDIGANPFENEYYNMGIYSTIYNNLLSEEFIRLLPKWSSVIVAFILILLASVIIRTMDAGRAILIGSALFLILVALYITLFVTTGVYLYILIPGLSYIIVFIQMISGKLLSTSKERTFIKSAFGQYLSEDVIKEILNDPSKLQLGGEKKEITAFFTDVKGFSTLSEKLTPDELVHLLNAYLTAMSDIALEHSGTIDKYEGDAIIGFYGAPHPIEDHATKAVMAAIRMKEKEKELNSHFLGSGMAPSPLQTRIGINSGPCVVGNMGTPKKMDYTMMGNDVNIAARLEGVNKQYGTWILASEKTIEEADDIFVLRRLDRVRVVGINEPIRLYNPLGFKEEADENLINMVDCFEEGLNKFEDRKWREAKIKFKEALALEPDDKPSQRYIKMCDKFLSEPPEDGWDGVFNLSSK